MMVWRHFGTLAVLSIAFVGGVANADDFGLPAGPEKAALTTPHFPDALHAFVWRNWQLVDAAKLAEVVGAEPAQIEEIVSSMGLPAAGKTPPEWRQRGYITLVRRNWHLLPYEQLLTLLDMSAAELGEALREDDFLYVKLGQLKPRCEPIRYTQPSPAVQARAAEIAASVKQHFPDIGKAPAEQPFAFLRHFGQPATKPPLSEAEADARIADGLRYIYSYFGTFGDPLSDPSLNPYPDALLQQLADNGVNGVWLHVVLRQLVPPTEAFPEFGEGHERRLETLRDLVARARRRGIAVYLYINEPRAMPASFFAKRPEMAGVQEGEFTAMCTSDPRVRLWLSDSLAYVFRETPHLGGAFTITASENFTNCASHGQHAKCPRCSQRTSDEVIAEVNQAIAEGVHRGNPKARVICWDWGWNNHGDAAGIINLLPKDVWLQSVSEWDKPIERGGVKSKIGEYSISAVGPGPRAERHWILAHERGLKASAKVQLNITWEMSAVPYLPVLDLVAEHCENLTKQKVDGTMLSWSLGGYPSPNLKIAQRFATQPEATAAAILDDLAKELYGAEGANDARAAWTHFSKAYSEYPYSGIGVYAGPQQMGPANLLFAEPSGYSATMVGLPYDQLESWRGPYPAEVYAAQMQKVADGWRVGLPALEKATAEVPSERKESAVADLGLARAAYCHFASAANQANFILARQTFLAPSTSDEHRVAAKLAMLKLLDDEVELAKTLHHLVGHDSRIGFEASNHYYYVAGDLVEKVLSCEEIRSEIDGREATAR